MMRGQCDGLARLGHDVSLLVRMPEGADDSAASFNGITEHRYPVNRTNSLSYLLTSFRASVSHFDTIATEFRPNIVMIHQSISGIGPIMLRRKKC